MIFAVVGVEFKEDFGKGFEADRKGRCGILSWHRNLQNAFIACSEINGSGGSACVKKTINGQLEGEIIDTILEAIL